MTEQEKREKVIKGLEHVVEVFDGRITGPWYEGWMKLTKDAIALLKAEEAMKPVPAIDDVGDWLCGNCYQSVIGEEELDASGFAPVKFNFCPNCGRKVKWE